jgi:hypothetical protein
MNRPHNSSVDLVDQDYRNGSIKQALNSGRKCELAAESLQDRARLLVCGVVGEAARVIDNSPAFVGGEGGKAGTSETGVLCFCRKVPTEMGHIFVRE